MLNNGRAFLISSVACLGMVAIFVSQCRSEKRMDNIVQSAYQPTPVPTIDPYATPEPEPTPEPTAVPTLFKVSLILANNANGGQWTIACPGGCSSVGEFIHEDASGVWFNDINNKFVWIRTGSGTVLIEEQ